MRRPGTCRHWWRPGLFYLLLTVPLTHLVNFIDARLRRGREPGQEDPLELSTSQEMI